MKTAYNRMKASISANLTNPDTTDITTRGNRKSGSKVAAENTDEKTPQWAGRWSNLGADHSKRWEKRLYLAKSGGVELGKLAVRIQHLGLRQEFRFNTTNRQKAAADALEIFRFLKANGWDATLAKFKPEGEQAKLDTTIGDFLAAVRDTNRFRMRTFLNYQNAMRIVTAETLGVKPDKGTSKFDYADHKERITVGLGKYLDGSIATATAGVNVP
jgi:hypothetical protein